MNTPHSVRTIKRLTAAEGYLELALPDLALEELADIEQGDPYTPVADWLTGEALKEKQQYDAAIESLSRAVRELPAPHNQPAIRSLADCYRKTDRADLAELAELFQQSSADAEANLPPSNALDRNGPYLGLPSPRGGLDADEQQQANHPESDDSD